MTESERKNAALALLGMGVLTLLIGAAGLWAAASLAASGDASQGWAQTKGRVIASGVETRRDVSATDLGRFGPDRYEHLPAVRYTYTVRTQMHTADRVRFGERNAERGAGGRERAQAEADLYPEGADVTVHYDPADPDTAVLEPGRQGTPWMIGVGGVAALAGLAMVGFGVRIRRAGVAAV